MHEKKYVTPLVQDDLERLIQLFLKMSFIGFDELEMSERAEAVELFGKKVKHGIADFNRRLTVLEEKVQTIEKNID